MLNKTTSVSEDQIKELSVEECIELRRKLQDELAQFHRTNPGMLTRYLNKINERLFEVNYHLGHWPNEAHEVFDNL